MTSFILLVIYSFQELMPLDSLVLHHLEVPAGYISSPSYTVH